MDALDQPSGGQPLDAQSERPVREDEVTIEGDFLTCPVGHRFPREHLTIRNGQFVCPICDRTPWATAAPRRPWERVQLREPLMVVLLATVMLLAEMVSLIGLAASYSNAGVGGSTWLIVGATFSLVGAATAAVGVLLVIGVIRSAQWARRLLSTPLAVIGVGSALLAIGDLVAIGFNVSILNTGSPGAGWELTSTIFDALYFGALAGALCGSRGWRCGPTPTERGRRRSRRLPPGGSLDRGCCSIEERDDLFVGHLGEVPVELTHCEERRRGLQTDHLVRHRGQLIERGSWGDRHSQDHPPRPLRPSHRARRSCGGAGCDTVVHHDGDPPYQGRSGTVPAKTAGSPFELESLPLLDGHQLGVVDPCHADHPIVDDADAALADGAHGELRLEPHAELPDDNHVERRTEQPSHLGPHRYPTSGQTEHDHIVALEVLEPSGESPPGLHPVAESHSRPRPSEPHSTRLVVASRCQVRWLGERRGLGWPRRGLGRARWLWRPGNWRDRVGWPWRGRDRRRINQS